MRVLTDMPILNPLELQGRTVLVTGASSGIGRATAGLLAGLGARLVLVARDADRLEATARSLAGTDHQTVSFDLEQADEIPALVRRVTTEVGPLHGVVHSAGIFQVMPLAGMNTRRFEKTMRINVLSSLMLLRGLMQKGCHAPREASMVILASTAAFIGRPGQIAYCASKGALTAMVKAAAIELAPEGVRVNAVAPAAVRTEMLDRLEQTVPPEQFSRLEAEHPLGFGVPADVAGAVAFLLANTGRWITGTTLVVDGGAIAY